MSFLFRVPGLVRGLKRAFVVETRETEREREREREKEAEGAAEGSSVILFLAVWQKSPGAGVNLYR